MTVPLGLKSGGTRPPIPPGGYATDVAYLFTLYRVVLIQGSQVTITLSRQPSAFPMVGYVRLCSGLQTLLCAGR